MIPVDLFATGGGPTKTVTAAPLTPPLSANSAAALPPHFATGGAAPWITSPPNTTFTNSSATTSPGGDALGPNIQQQFYFVQPQQQQQQLFSPSPIPAQPQPLFHQVPQTPPPQQLQHSQQQVIITIVLQYGPTKECVVVERTPDPNALNLLRQKARQIVERQIQFDFEQAMAANNGLLKELALQQRLQSPAALISASDIHLFRHNYASLVVLECLSSLMQLDNGSVVEIIRVDRNDQGQLPTRPHQLDVHTYLTPTFCDYCGEMLLGIAKQGLQCQLCKCNFHKKCVFGPRNNCAKNVPFGSTPTTFLAGAGQFPLQQPMPDNGIKDQYNNCCVQSAPFVDQKLQQLPPSLQLPHTLSLHNYVTPTVCKICDKILVGLFKQGLKCRDCKVNVHKKCAHLLPPDCMITADGAVLNNANNNNSSSPGGTNSGRIGVEQMSIVPTTPTDPSTPPQHKMSMDSTISNNKKDSTGTLSSAEMPMIPLGRLPGSASSRSARHGAGYGGAGGPALCEGWLVHFVLQDETRRRLRHYWVLQKGVISLYNEYNDGVNPCRVYKQIQLGEVLALIPFNGPPIDDAHPPHCFEIRTIHNRTYCVGEKLEAYLSAEGTGGGGGKSAQRPFSAFFGTGTGCGNGVGGNHGVVGAGAVVPSGQGGGSGSGSPSWQHWFQAIQQSLQPPPLNTDAPNSEPALQFSQIYQINSDQILGSGQFGTVYAGVHRQSGREVAVKVISKDRFQKKSAAVETLKSEVNILQAVNHEGIIKLESMFETRDKIFVVMERMNGDMLEMILSQAAGRLDERCTKFLIVQILGALRYLHSQGIAHCDLKPENVLLSDFHSNFPQAKLCDFGYARFIGDAQFRKTIVGTPAYLAPEVLKKKGYNKSLDMWSVGVIIYVTLSGTFPFNEGEEISDQIHNADFMFPPSPWKYITAQAIDLIQHLLKVQIHERLTIDQCIAHIWLQDTQVQDDLHSYLCARLGHVFECCTKCNGGGGIDQQHQMMFM